MIVEEAVVATKTVPRAWVARQQAAIEAGQRIAGEEETAEDRALGRKVLTGELTADEAIAQRLAQIDTKYGHTR